MRDNYIEFLNFASNQAKADILTMTTVAESGHPGGSISSLDLYLTTLLFSNIFENSDRIKLELDPISIEQKEYFKLSTQRDMDSFYISHGHTAPAWYAAMGAFGILDREEYLTYYRKMGTCSKYRSVYWMGYGLAWTRIIRCGRKSTIFKAAKSEIPSICFYGGRGAAKGANIRSKKIY